MTCRKTFAFALFLLGSTNLTAEDKQAPALPAGKKLLPNLEYSSVEGTSLQLDLYLPQSPTQKLCPVVIWIHGGGWANGKKENSKARFLLDHGIAVASINYRLSATAQWPAQINDCYAAVRWLRQNAAHYGLDPAHIGAFGSSAGGHLAALLGTRPYPGEETTSSKVKAVCDWYGPSDLLTMPANLMIEGRTHEEVAKTNGARLLGNAIVDVPELAKDASAYYQVSEGDAPFLIMHGEEDPAVPIEQSKKLHQALSSAKVPSKLVSVAGAGHGGKEFKTPEVQQEVVAFFLKHLQ